ncbi:hypothetical protein ACO0LG_20815 [Undibacterium sp. Ji42W]|uniref:hypothetical protein n=1 Tax=Undibacterium sp. Ji42W TaxID=3413039 RepID=UPI003BF3FA0B
MIGLGFYGFSFDQHPLILTFIVFIESKFTFSIQVVMNFDGKNIREIAFAQLYVYATALLALLQTLDCQPGHGELPEVKSYVAQIDTYLFTCPLTLFPYFSASHMQFKKSAAAAFIFVALLGLAAFFLFGREPVDPAKPQVFNADTAMLAIFGTYNEKQHGVLLPEKNTASWDMGQADILATVLLVDIYTEAGKKKAVLVVQRQQILGGVVEESHATAPVISVYVFAYNGKQWLFEKGKKEVAAYGANGMAPMASLIRLG